MKERRLHQICVQIERLRSKMHHVALTHGISHPKVLMVSMRLDIKINRYMELAREP